MQFLLIAYDGTDPEAPHRRSNVREGHLEKMSHTLQKVSGKKSKSGPFV